LLSLIFQSYAILLNPFWINWKVKELVDSGTRMTEEQSANSDFKRLNWSAFFKIYLKEFNLSTAYQTTLEIQKQINLYEWPPYLLFPEEGNCDSKQLKFILSQLQKVYGDTLADFYYCILKTKKGIMVKFI